MLKERGSLGTPTDKKQNRFAHLLGKSPDKANVTFAELKNATPPMIGGLPPRSPEGPLSDPSVPHSMLFTKHERTKSMDKNRRLSEGGNLLLNKRADIIEKIRKHNSLKWTNAAQDRWEERFVQLVSLTIDVPPAISDIILNYTIDPKDPPEDYLTHVLDPDRIKQNTQAKRSPEQKTRPASELLKTLEGTELPSRIEEMNREPLSPTSPDEPHHRHNASANSLTIDIASSNSGARSAIVRVSS